jgi:hypothetical protein
MSEYAPVPPSIPEADQCDAETAGYDGMFGVYCVLPKGHAGPHNDGWVEWRFTQAVEEQAVRFSRALKS